MSKVKREDISEESRFVVECPHCNSLTDLNDYSEYDEEAFCEHCMKVIKIED